MKASHWVSKCGVHEPSAFEMSSEDTSASCTLHMCRARGACTLTTPPVVITGSYLCVHRREGFISAAIAARGKESVHNMTDSTPRKQEGEAEPAKQQV